MAGTKSHVVVALAMTLGITTVNGQCQMVEKGATNCEKGIFFPVNGAAGTPVSSGSVATIGGLWCPKCAFAQQGDKAPVAGKLWTDPEADAVDVSAGDTAPSGGLFCPDGSECGLVDKGTKAGSDGVFFPLGEPVEVTTTGEKATMSGMWCQKCVITSNGMTAEESGKWWSGADSEPADVKEGDTAPGPGMFCPDSATGECPESDSTSGSVRGAMPTAAALAAVSFAASTLILGL